MFCFFKHKTAYEMRISDWSSDVCSSDLPEADADVVRVRNLVGRDDAGAHRREGLARLALKERVAVRRQAARRPVEEGDIAEDVRHGVGGRHVARPLDDDHRDPGLRSEEHTSELQSLIRITYAVL